MNDLLPAEEGRSSQELVWVSRDIDDFERQLDRNEARRRVLRRRLLGAVLLLCGSVWTFVATLPRLRGSLLVLAPTVSIGATLLLAIIATIQLWAEWSIREALAGGLAEARAHGARAREHR